MIYKMVDIRRDSNKMCCQIGMDLHFFFYFNTKNRVRIQQAVHMGDHQPFTTKIGCPDDINIFHETQGDTPDP
jgi:hypothetical protein